MTIHARCWQASVGSGFDRYVGYVFAETPGKARYLAACTDPEGEHPSLTFTTYKLKRWAVLDGLCESNTAFWDTSELPPDLLHYSPELWADD